MASIFIARDATVRRDEDDRCSRVSRRAPPRSSIRRNYVNPLSNWYFTAASTFLVVGLHDGQESADRLVEEITTVAPWFAEAVERWSGVLAPFEEEGIRFHALRTRQAARRAFISVHVLVPQAWSVQRGHDESGLAGAGCLRPVFVGFACEFGHAASCSEKLR